ncbi:unnamed protein product, partial [Choristocarpus tenellus]
MSRAVHHRRAKSLSTIPTSVCGPGKGAVAIGSSTLSPSRSMAHPRACHHDTSNTPAFDSSVLLTGTVARGSRRINSNAKQEAGRESTWSPGRRSVSGLHEKCALKRDRGRGLSRGQGRDHNMHRNRGPATCRSGEGSEKRGEGSLGRGSRRSPRGDACRGVKGKFCNCNKKGQGESSDDEEGSSSKSPRKEIRQSKGLSRGGGAQEVGKPSGCMKGRGRVSLGGKRESRDVVGGKEQRSCLGDDGVGSKGGGEWRGDTNGKVCRDGILEEPVEGIMSHSHKNACHAGGRKRNADPAASGRGKRGSEGMRRGKGGVVCTLKDQG